MTWSMTCAAFWRPSSISLLSLVIAWSLFTVSIVFSFSGWDSLVVGEPVTRAEQRITLSAHGSNEKLPLICAQVGLTVAGHEHVLHEHAALDVTVEIVGIDAQRDPLLANAALQRDEL